MSSPIMYENRGMPRSLSSNSKLENLRGISSKWFSRKGTNTTIDVSGGGCSNNTSPVDTIATFRSVDDYSPFSSRNSAISYRAPPTPPTSYPSTSHLQSSPGQASGISTSPSNASSLCTTASSTMGGAFSDCCFCDIPLGYILGSEDIVELSCTHLAHFECLLRLSLVLNKNRAPSKQARLPPCGVCDEPSSFVRKDLGLSFNEKMHNMLLTIPVSPTSTGAGGPPSPAGPSASTSKLEEAPSTLKRSSQVIKTCKCQMTSCHGATCGIQFSAQLSQALPSNGPAKLQCLINVSVPKQIFYNNGYIRTPSDDVKVYSQISKLKRLSFKGISLNRIDMSQLRMVNNYKVSSDLCNWSLCTLYLLSDSLILTSNRDAQVKAVIDLKGHLASAKILGRELVPHIELVIKSLQKSKLYLICDEIEPLEALCAALHNENLTFPVGDAEATAVVPQNFGQVLYRTPLNVVVCFEQPQSPLQADAFAETLVNLRKRMGPLDRLALVIYGSTIRSFGFQAANSSSWCKIDDSLRKTVTSNSGGGSVCLDKCLGAAEDLLHNLRIERSVACVMIVNSSPGATVGPISPGFYHSDTPIHTIGINDECDFASLSRLAAKTDGVSVSCEPEHLAEKVEALYGHTSSRTHKNVEMKLVPGEGVSVSGIYGYDMVSVFEKFDEITTEPANGNTCREETPIIPLGSMHEGSTRSFIVDIEIEECATLTEDHLLQSTLFSRAPQSISHHRCTSTNLVCSSDLIQDEAPIALIKRQATLDACELACKLASLLMHKEHKQAFKLTQSDRCEFSKRYISESVTDPSLTQLLGQFDGFFDEFSNKLFQPRVQLTGELFNFIWINSVKGVDQNS